MSNVWYFMGIAGVIILAGFHQDNCGRTFFGRVLVWPGVLLLGVSLLAGFKGPVTIGAVKINRFGDRSTVVPLAAGRVSGFSASKAVINESPMAYAHRAVECRGHYIYRKGGGQTDAKRLKLKMWVHNKGLRNLSSVTVEIPKAYKDGRTERVVLTAKFRARTYKTVEVHAVGGDSAGTKHNIQIVEASF